MAKPTRWGICGSGKIAHDFSVCLKALPAAEHEIIAVAARSKSKAEEFAQKFDIPNSYGSYDQLLDNDNIDIVYVNTIHPYHVELCLKFLNAGKSVLCEKPMALSLEGCQAVLEAAKRNNVFFAEAFWSRFFPAYAFIKNEIESGSLGEIKMVEATLCLPIIDVARINDKSMGGGGLMDIGCYTLQAANFIFKEKPENVWSDGTMCSVNGVDKNAVIVLSYSGGRFAILNYNIETQVGSNKLIIRGTKGTIEIPDKFVCPEKVLLNGEIREFPLPELKDKLNYGNSMAGLTYEAQGIRNCLINGLKESPHISHADSESIMMIMQQVMDNLGMKYDAR